MHFYVIFRFYFHQTKLHAYVCHFVLRHHDNNEEYENTTVRNALKYLTTGHATD